MTGLETIDTLVTGKRANCYVGSKSTDGSRECDTVVGIVGCGLEGEIRDEGDVAE